MRVPYGIEEEYFRYSLFLVFCNRIMTFIASGIVLIVSQTTHDPIDLVPLIHLNAELVTSSF